MAHYTVGLKSQAPLLLVITATALDTMARVDYTEIVGRFGAGPGTASRPVWSRVTTAGVGPSTITPIALEPLAAPSVFRGEFAYGVNPVIGFSSSPFPIEARDGYAARTRFPRKSGPVFYGSCPLAIQADAAGTSTWDASVVFEEL